MKKYKLLKVEGIEATGYDCYHDATYLLKDHSDWVELTEEQVKHLRTYIKANNHKSSYNYYLIEDVCDQIGIFIQEGIKLGKEIEEKEAKKALKNKLAKEKREKTIAEKQKKRKILEINAAKDLLKKQGYSFVE